MRDRLVQLVFVGVTLAALTAAAMLQGQLQSQRDELNLVTVTADPNIVKDPRIALLQIAPGGLRAPFLTYLWIRSQQLKDDGRLFDAKQLRDLICDLMPYYSGVWAFHAWDMAWNISVQTHTPQERWMWVSNGLELLRDRGLFYNPKDLVLHHQLAWIFFNKMGQYTDEMHMVYKRRWAARMQRLLGSPPITERTEEVIEAFRPIAEAPGDLEALLAERAVAEFVKALRANGVQPDETFLPYYNRFSADPLVAPFGWLRDPPADPRERRIAELMSSDAHAAARARLLAFARRKVLVETYKMDPNWMLQLMEKYGPFDWRQVNPHGLYWATLGLHRAQGLNLADMHPLNTGRILLGALKSLTRTGQYYYTPDPKNPDDPDIDWQPDWRFIEPTHQAYVTAGEKMVAGPDKLHSSDNMYRDAHLTYLSNAIMQLYIGGREQDAQHYYTQVKELLKPEGMIYELSLLDFVRAKRMEFGTPPSDMARAFWAGALRSAYRALAGGNHNEYLRRHAFAQRTFKSFADGAVQRLRPEEGFDAQERGFLVTLLLRPQALAMRVPLLAKVRLYRALSTDKKRAIYDLVAEGLRRECQQEGLDFDKAFPAPPGAAPPSDRKPPRAAL